MFCISVCHHMSSLRTTRGIELLTKTQSSREGFTLPVLVPTFVVIEYISKFRNSCLKVIRHDSMELLLHFLSELVIVQTCTDNM